MQLQLSSMRQLLQAAEEREKALKNDLDQLRLESDSSSSPADAPKENKRTSLGLMVRSICKFIEVF